MKLRPAEVQRWLATPDPKVVIALFFGPDTGAVRDGADRLARAVLAGSDDPFALAAPAVDTLTKDASILVDEAAALSLMGGRRVVRVRGAVDGLASSLQFVLDNPASQNLIVLEAGELAPKSKLRQTCEAADRAVAVACYPPEGQSLSRLIGAELARHGLSPTPEAARFLAESLVGDSGQVRAELDKLATYVGGGGRVDLGAAMACVGDRTRQSLTDLAYAVADGAAANADRALDKVLAEGMDVVPILRAAANHLRTLHAGKAGLAAGVSTEQIARRNRVFFKLQPAFERQLRTLPTSRIAAALAHLTDAEAGCKRTGAPAVVLCRQGLMAAVQVLGSGRVDRGRSAGG